MRWIRFSTQGRTAYGSLDGDTVTEISGEPWGDHAPTGAKHRFSDVTLEVPVIPRTFYAAGINYAAHIREMAAKRGVEPVFPEKADIGYRANNALIPHEVIADVFRRPQRGGQDAFRPDVMAQVVTHSRNWGKSNRQLCRSIGS